MSVKFLLACVPLLVPAMALSQIAPPPPAPPAPPPEYVPEEPRRPSPPPRPQVDAVEIPADVKWESLAVLGPDGKIIRLTRPTELVALDANPFMGEIDQEALELALAERRAALVRSLNANIDLIVNVERGLIDRLDIMDRAGLSTTLETLQPLKPSHPMSEYLQAREVFTPLQGTVHTKIVQEYQSAVIDEIKVEPIPEGVPDTIMNRITRFMLNESIAETRDVLYAILLDAVPVMAELGPTFTFKTDEDRLAFEGGMERARDASDAPGRLAGAREAFLKLDTRDQRRVLNRLAEIQGQ